MSQKADQHPGEVLSSNPENPSLQNDFIDVSVIWEKLREGRRTIFKASAIGFLLAAGYSLTMHNVYTATAAFITPKSSTSGMSLLTEQLATLSGGGLSGGSKTGEMYVSILQSKRIQSDMVARFHLLQVYRSKKESQAENILASQSKFEAGEQDNILRIRVTNRDPKLARDMANAYMDELRETNGKLALTEASQRRLFFEQQMEDEKAALDNADTELAKTQEHSGFVAPAPQTSLQVQGVAALRESIQAREVQLSGVLQGATAQDPTVIRLRSELASLRGQLAEMLKGQNSETGGISTAKVPEAQLEYMHKQRDVTYHETLLAILSKQYEAARLDEAHDAPVLQVLDVATIPDTKSGPKRSLIAICGMLIGAFGAMIWLLMFSRSAPSFRIAK